MTHLLSPLSQVFVGRAWGFYRGGQRGEQKVLALGSCFRFIYVRVCACVCWTVTKIPLCIVYSGKFRTYSEFSVVTENKRLSCLYQSIANFTFAQCTGSRFDPWRSKYFLTTINDDFREEKKEIVDCYFWDTSFKLVF